MQSMKRTAECYRTGSGSDRIQALKLKTLSSVVQSYCRTQVECWDPVATAPGSESSALSRIFTIYHLPFTKEKEEHLRAPLLNLTGVTSFDPPSVLLESTSQASAHPHQSSACRHRRTSAL